MEGRSRLVPFPLHDPLIRFPRCGCLCRSLTLTSIAARCHLGSSSLTKFFDRLSDPVSALLPHCLGTLYTSNKRVSVNPEGFLKYWDFFGLALELLIRQDQKCERLKTPKSVLKVLKSGWLELDVTIGQGDVGGEPDGVTLLAEEVWSGVMRLRGGCGEDVEEEDDDDASASASGSF